MGFNQFYRFAAVEVAEADFKAKAVSLVMVGGIVSGTLAEFSFLFDPEGLLKFIS